MIAERGRLGFGRLLGGLYFEIVDVTGSRNSVAAAAQRAAARELSSQNQ